MRTLTSFGLFCCLSICTAQTYLHPGVTPHRSALLRAGTLSPASAATGPRLYLDVWVTDASGKPVPGLTQSDFTVEDNHHPQSLSTFNEVAVASPGETAHAVLLLDALNDKSSGEFAKQVKAVEQFLAGAAAPLSFSVSVAMVSESGYIQGNPSRDPAQLVHDLHGFATGVKVVDCSNQDSDSSDNAAEAPMITKMNGDSLDMMEGLEGTVPKGCRGRHVSRSLSALVKIADEQAGIPGRAILVWIGPGWPLLSGKAEQGDWFKRSIRVMNSIREAQLTLDVVSTTDFEHDKEFRRVDWATATAGVADSGHATAANVALPVIARQSGGLVLDKSKDMAAAIAACVAGANRYYVVSFDTAPAATPNALHAIDVKVNRAGATAHTLALYYTKP